MRTVPVLSTAEPSSTSTPLNSNNMEIDTPTPSTSTLSPDPITSPLNFIAKRSSELIKVIDDLSHLGIENKDIQLPKIVAVGDQSSGKSSLIEQLSGMRMPRDTGTCTRVPFHINTSRSNENWTCQIFLDLKYSYHKNTTYTKSTPFAPWTERSEISEQFATLHDPEDLEMVLRRAQLALLNPCKDSRYFYSCDVEEIAQQCMEVGFSPNIVRVEITSTDVQDLSFYDLPGIFAQTADGQQDLPLFVHALVTSYVQEEHNIILLVMPMNTDRENCFAGKLVELKGGLDRAVGVLTKPDRLEPGVRLDNWTSVLSGRAHILGHGYFVTRQPSPEELSRHITRTEALQNEVEFFATTTPWTTHFGRFEHNFGALKIQEKLGELLVAKIKDVIPRVAVQIDAKLLEVSQGLARLPPPPGNKAMSIVCSVLGKIEQDLASVFSGNVELELFQEYRKLVHDLGVKLKSSSPGLTLPPPVFELSSSDEEPPTPKKNNSNNNNNNNKRNAASFKATISPTKKPKREGRRDESISSASTSTHMAPAVIYTIDDIRAMRTSADISGIPNAVDSRAMKKPIGDMLYYWEQPIARFVDDVNALVIKQGIMSILSRNLSAWETTPLAQGIYLHTTDILAIIKDDILKDAQRTLYSERSTQFMIFDYDYFEFIKSKEMDRMKELRDAKFMPEIDLFCSIKAYLHVCAMSLVHHVAKHVLSIFSEIKTQIMSHLHNKLGLEEDGGRDVMAKCQALLEEDEGRARDRTRLEHEKKKWEGAQKRLQEVMHE